MRIYSSSGGYFPARRLAHPQRGLVRLLLARSPPAARVTRDLACSSPTALLEGGAAVDAVDEHGATILMAAARHGQAECARLLFWGGAAVDAVDSNGHTALVYAANFGQAEIARLRG